jgi:hypothetical protein
MNRICASLVLAAGLTISSQASAQATRTWVSGVGDDVNPCSRTAPCKTFAGAISKTAANGEINAIDPGGFGALTITKSITVDGNGAHASILSANTNGLIINGAGIVVNLRNLSINGAGTAAGNGIRIINAAAVNIDNVVCENQGGTATNGRGVAVETSTANVRVNVQNSRFANLTNFGVDSAPTAGNVILNLDNVSFVRGGATAILIRQNTAARINNTRVSGHNPGAAVALQLGTAGAHISNSVFTDNAFGVFNGEGGAPITRISNTVITGSATAGLQINSGQVISYGNNPIRGNAGNEVPSSVELPR